MARNFLATVGECLPDNLTGDTLVYQKRGTVSLKVAGTYDRGQLLVVSAAMEATIPGATAVTVDAILLEQVGVIDGTEVIEAAVSFTGEWNENKVLWGAITDANKPVVKKSAAAKQLFIAPMEKVEFAQFGEVI